MRAPAKLIIDLDNVVDANSNFDGLGQMKPNRPSPRSSHNALALAVSMMVDESSNLADLTRRLDDAMRDLERAKLAVRNFRR